jgi:hypothetical protein
MTVRNYLSSNFPIENCLKTGICLITPLGYAAGKVQETNLEMVMNGTHQVLTYANNVSLIGDENSR